MLEHAPTTTPSRRLTALTAILLLLVALASATATARTARTTSNATTKVTVIASGLNQPKKLTIDAAGDLIVALSGDGAAPTTCTDGDQPACLDDSGAIDEITPAGRVTRLAEQLPSIAEGAGDPQATGPVEATLLPTGRLEVLFQNTLIDARTGSEIYGSKGALLDELVGIDRETGATTVAARFGRFEARHNPDHGAGTDVTYGLDHAIDSDPYSFVAYRGGWAVADAGANDLLFVSRTGRVSVLAVFPTITERARAGTYGKRQTRAIEAQAQAVPTAVAVGPDGALYVGELGGIPFARGTSSVYRVVPGHAPRRYATGFTAIGDIAFDPQGRLLVLELDQRGLDDPGLNDGHPASGALIRIDNDETGTRTNLVTRGLDLPTGLAVAGDGEAYISTYGTTPASDGRGGELVRVDVG